jgi:C-terminal processing protease CtpA/Prc
MRWILLIIFIGWMAPSALAPPPAGLGNADFESGAVGDVPPGWFLPPMSRQAGYDALTTDDGPHEGNRCARIVHAGDAAPQGFGNLMQSINAAAYRGQRIAFKAAVRVNPADPNSRAQLWLRVDRPNNGMGFFDNMGDRPIQTTAWRDYEIVGEVAPDAVQLNVGLMLIGSGSACIDAAAITILGPAGAGDEPAAPLTDRGLKNLIALTRLLGYVRHFHPSDEAAAINWDDFVIAAFRAGSGIEAAESDEWLAERLFAVIQPVAPTVRVFVGEDRPETAAELLVPDDPIGLRLVSWMHHGYGQPATPGLYSSNRRFQSPDEPQRLNPAEPLIVDLTDDVHAAIPLVLYAEARGTLPRAAASPQPIQHPAGFVASGDDRATRLAAVATAWNILQHFYPYFDVVETDWPAALETALTSAATDLDSASFLRTLRRLIAQLHDGHGHVMHRAEQPSAGPPLAWDWIEEQLVVTHVDRSIADRVQPGDVVAMIDDVEAADAIQREEQFISAATPQFRRWRALQQLGAGPQGSEIRLALERGAEQLEITLPRSVFPASIVEPRPPKVHEIKPGVWYLDLNAIDDRDFNATLPNLQNAAGIIFDMRGYPSRLSIVPLAHLIDEAITCAQWHVPLVTVPDRRDLQFSVSDWQVNPIAPRLTCPVAFITDGRAISYAETWMGMVEHYRLAAIVGGPTAGTNGNVNPITLPGGYSVMWTGMKVLKHDGSQHHGIGIRPTIPASRTIAGVAAGRDELLEAAIEAVSKPRD